jgi:hypothetical protein
MKPKKLRGKHVYYDQFTENWVTTDIPLIAKIGVGVLIGLSITLVTIAFLFMPWWFGLIILALCLWVLKGLVV